jgi:hypothetical protein
LIPITSGQRRPHQPFSQSEHAVPNYISTKLLHVFVAQPSTPNRF